MTGLVDPYTVSKLIELVRVNPSIYDPRDPQHTNRAVVNSVWKLIAAEMNVSENSCREKWANLRSNFARELRKARRKYSEEGAISNRSESQWLFYDAMGFLAPFVKSRLMTCSEDETNNLKTEVGTWSPWGEIDGAAALCEIQEANGDNGNISSGNLLSGNGSNSNSQLPKQSKKRKTTELDQLSSNESIDDSRFRIMDDSENSTDDNKLFLLSLLPQMKTLSLTDNLAFRIEVQTLLFNRLTAKVSTLAQTDIITNENIKFREENLTEEHILKLKNIKDNTDSDSGN